MNYQNRSTLRPRLTPEECARRSKELDEREAYINEREKALESLEHEVMILDKSILLKNEQFDKISRDIEQNTKTIERQAKDRIKVLTDTITDREAELIDLGKALEEVDIATPRREVVRLEKTLVDVQSEIVERKKYLQTQEDLISSAMEEGNLKLQSIKYELHGFEVSKSAMVNDLAELNKEKIRIVDSLADLQERKTKEEAVYAVRHSEIASSLDIATANVAQAVRHYKRISDDTNEKLKILSVKEEQLLAKQAALQREQEELATIRRRLEGVQSLYG